MVTKEQLENLTTDQILSCLQLLFPNKSSEDLMNRINDLSVIVRMDMNGRDIQFLEYNSTISPKIGMVRLSYLQYGSKKHDMIVAYLDGLVRNDKINIVLDE